ncbi:MAG: DpnII family type II restriction endonuclease [Patescibacteria group bacterium]
MIKKIQNNLYYFKISQQNPEKILDGFYISNEKHPQLQKYIANTKEIKNILITIRTLQKKNEDKKIIAKYFSELSKTLGRFSNCSEFACFINTCDSFLDLAKRDIILLEKIARRYFEKRVLNEAVPEEWIQAILDSNSSRKKGKCGEKKLLHILAKYGFQEVKTWKDFFKKQKSAAKFSKIFSIKNVRKNLGIKLAAKKQNKKLDLIVKMNGRIFLCEAKHLNTSGGEQDKQIAELIEIISLKEQNKNISYIAFLDGSYSNVLLNNEEGGDKLNTQRKEIIKYLSRNHNNFWVNTAGFKNLFKI